MSMMDKLKQMLKGHEHHASKGVDKGGDMIDERTQGRYSGQVDTGQDRLKEQFGGDQPGQGQDKPPQP
ncbi:antitoxin [Streptomyces sp. NPDC049887]|uniref:antitoxin n=1 Tax=unclassified Streptomyces TaxID=2593676 RepID=UPI00342B40D5